MDKPAASGQGARKKSQAAIGQSRLAAGHARVHRLAQDRPCPIDLIQYRDDFFNLQELNRIDEFLGIYTATESASLRGWTSAVLHDVQLISHEDFDGQVSLIVSKRLVSSFQKKCHGCVGPDSRSIAHRQGRIAAAGMDYLQYSLIDAVVDNYFAVLEFMEEQLERIEDRLLAAPSPVNCMG